MRTRQRTESGATTAGLSPDDASFLQQLASCSSQLAGGINPVFLAFELPDGRRVKTVAELCERPRADVMPARAKAMLVPGASMRTTPITRPVAHSASCTARSPAWEATRAAEQAVS